MFARALCDAQLVRYCYQAIGSLPPNLASPLASLLAQDKNNCWPEVTDANTQLLVSLSRKILANDRKWILSFPDRQPHEKRRGQRCSTDMPFIHGAEFVVEQNRARRKAFSLSTRHSDGIVRCAAWLVDNFITTLFLMFNIVFGHCGAKPCDERQKKERLAQWQGPAASGAHEQRAETSQSVKQSGSHDRNSCNL